MRLIISIIFFFYKNYYYASLWKIWKVCGKSSKRGLDTFWLNSRQDRFRSFFKIIRYILFNFVHNIGSSPNTEQYLIWKVFNDSLAKYWNRSCLLHKGLKNWNNNNDQKYCIRYFGAKARNMIYKEFLQENFFCDCKICYYELIWNFGFGIGFLLLI